MNGIIGRAPTFTQRNKIMELLRTQVARKQLVTEFLKSPYINLSESIVRSSHNHILSLLNTFSVNDKIK